MVLDNVDVMVTEYHILESRKQKWSIHFTYEDVTYMVRISGMKQEEVERIVMNLIFVQ